MTKIIVNGCSGKMGRVICSLIRDDAECEIAAGIDIVQNNAAFPVFTNINDCDMPADVIIDFSSASAVDEVIEYALKKELPLIICTTGLSEETLSNIEEASKKIPVFKSANMSLGINLIASLLKKASKILYESGFDIEITERHHNQKTDAPSGTALLLADAINKDNEFDYVYDRSQRREKRSRKEIGISSLRGGSIVGEHSVVFAGKDEVIEFKHSAYSKEVFALGALKAAKFIVGKPAGKYDMQDITDEI